jgi:hypothetical protein
LPPSDLEAMSRHLTGSETTTPTTATPPDLHQEYIHRSAWKSGVLGALNLATAILAVRLILLISVCGAVWLASRVLAEPDLYRLISLGAYLVGAVVPLVLLAARR